MLRRLPENTVVDPDEIHRQVRKVIGPAADAILPFRRRSNRRAAAARTVTALAERAPVIADSAPARPAGAAP